MYIEVDMYKKIFPDKIYNLLNSVSIKYEVPFIFGAAAFIGALSSVSKSGFIIEAPCYNGNIKYIRPNIFMIVFYNHIKKTTEIFDNFVEPLNSIIHDNDENQIYVNFITHREILDAFRNYKYPELSIIDNNFSQLNSNANNDFLINMLIKGYDNQKIRLYNNDLHKYFTIKPLISMLLYAPSIRQFCNQYLWENGLYQRSILLYNKIFIRHEFYWDKYEHAYIEYMNYYNEKIKSLASYMYHDEKSAKIITLTNEAFIIYYDFLKMNFDYYSQSIGFANWILNSGEMALKIAALFTLYENEFENFNDIKINYEIMSIAIRFISESREFIKKTLRYLDFRKTYTENRNYNKCVKLIRDNNINSPFSLRDISRKTKIRKVELEQIISKLLKNGIIKQHEIVEGNTKGRKKSQMYDISY